MFDNSSPDPVLDIVRQQRNNLMVRLMELEIRLAIQEAELRGYRNTKPDPESKEQV